MIQAPQHAPGLVVAAPRSGSGKTTLTLGLLRALRRRSLVAQGLKCGPDYIDPAFHAAASGRAGINLDGWAMPPATIAGLARQAMAAADIGVCEGLMGLFDGVPAPAGRSGSSADIAVALGWPVLLVLDVSGQSQSAAALALGCANYDRRLKIAGVVLNRVGSPRHRRLAGDAIAALGIPVLGALPRAPHLVLPERHLGLVQASETEGLDRVLDAMADFVEANVDVSALIAAALPMAASIAGQMRLVSPPGQRIALAQDRAFSFFYPHLMQGWRAAGAEFSIFSPLADEAPAGDCDICWLPGGYPELYAGQLAAAGKFMAGIRGFAAQKPVHGECGGYMTLGQGLVDAAGMRHEMAGLLGVSTSFAARKLNLGYREAELLADGPLGRAGVRLRGHEFHYATVIDDGGDAAFAQTRDAYGSEPLAAGARRGKVSGSFFHVIAGEDDAILHFPPQCHHRKPCAIA